MAPVCAVVVAGGSGQRFGNPGGKQLVNVAGRPLMSWSIRAFDRSDKVGHIVVVCPAERRAEMRRLAIDRLTMTRPSVLPMPAIPARTPPVPACMRYRRVSNMSPSTTAPVRSSRPRPSIMRSTCLWATARSTRRVRPARDRHAQDRRRRQYRRDAAARALLGRADAADL